MTVGELGDSVPSAYLCEPSFAHMARRVTEVRAARVTQWYKHM